MTRHAFGASAPDEIAGPGEFVDKARARTDSGRTQMNKDVGWQGAWTGTFSRQNRAYSHQADTGRKD